MSEMIERVTRALCTNDPDFKCCRKCGPLAAKARAAIEVMREPSQIMLDAANNEPVEHCWSNKGEFITRESAGEIYQTMIDVALK